MRICIFSDVHWSKKSSLINKDGIKYSQRLEQLIRGMNWVNQVAVEKDCQLLVCAGDFFHNSFCSDDEITALREINWTNLDCYFLCGNHESSVKDLRYSTIKILEKPDAPHRYIIDRPTTLNIEGAQVQFIPYIKDVAETASILDYLPNIDALKTQIIFSHNDIAGIAYGNFVSKEGFRIEDIEQNCALFLNGHIHNSEWITNKILNVGSFSGHNFTNDSFKYKYGIWILDTATLSIEFIENPFSFNFYKLNINTESDLNVLVNLKPNSVLSIKCKADLKEALENLIPNIAPMEYRIILDTENAESALVQKDQAELTVDHLKELNKFIIAKLGQQSIIEEELLNISK